MTNPFLTSEQFTYIDTQANIEALTGLVGGERGYATDRASGQKEGYYDAGSAAWVWGSGGGGVDIPIVTSDPGTPTDGEMWLLRETTGAIADGVPIGLLLSLTYTGNAGSTAPLVLSVWDDDLGQIGRLNFTYE